MSCSKRGRPSSCPTVSVISYDLSARRALCIPCCSALWPVALSYIYISVLYNNLAFFCCLRNPTHLHRLHAYLPGSCHILTESSLAVPYGRKYDKYMYMTRHKLVPYGDNFIAALKAIEHCAVVNISKTHRCICGDMGDGIRRSSSICCCNRRETHDVQHCLHVAHPLRPIAQSMSCRLQPYAYYRGVSIRDEGMRVSRAELVPREETEQTFSSRMRSSKSRIAMTNTATLSGLTPLVSTLSKKTQGSQCRHYA